MGIILQRQTPISRVEMVNRIHDAMYSLDSDTEHPDFRWESVNSGDYFKKEIENCPNPVVAIYSWKDASNAVKYVRDLKAAWGQANLSAEARAYVNSIEQQCEELDIRPDSGLVFLTGLIPMEELGKGPGEKEVLESIAQNLIHIDDVIEKAAILQKDGYKAIISKVQ